MTESKTIAVGRALTPRYEQGDAVIAINDDQIKAVEPKRENEREVTLSYPDGIAVPGFVDAHVHGYGGYSIAGDAADYVGLAEGVVETGVTTVFPTTVSEPYETLLNAGEATVEATERDHDGADIAGLHLEGPHLNTEQRGAQDPSALREPDVEELQEIATVAKGTLARVTLAPELPGAEAFIETARDMGLIASAGHTAADYATANRRFDAGVSITTHLYNGMRSFHHRKPGILGASLVREDVTVELITDLIHLHPGAIALALAAKGPERCMLVTDAIAATGLPDGEYTLGDRAVVVEDSVSRLQDDGSLAGSTLTMDTAIRNVTRDVDIGLSTAVRMATEIPARAMDLDDRGRLAPGLRADMTILNSDLEVQATLVGGELVYERNG